MKIGGQILWNAIPICETFKISCLMGKQSYERRFGKPFEGTDHSVWLIGLSFNLFLRKTSQESINLERKFYLDCSLDTLCTRVEIWKGDILAADIEELETMDASEIYSKKDSMQRR